MLFLRIIFGGYQNGLAESQSVEYEGAWTRKNARLHVPLKGLYLFLLLLAGLSKESNRDKTIFGLKPKAAMVLSGPGNNRKG